jgi:hypothetical protein
MFPPETEPLKAAAETMIATRHPPGKLPNIPKKLVVVLFQTAPLPAEAAGLTIHALRP